MANESITKKSNAQKWQSLSERVSYEWNILNFNPSARDLFGCIKSPSFSSGLCKWYMCFYPSGMWSKGGSGIYLRLESSPNETVFVSSNVVLTDSKRRLLGSWNGEKSLSLHGDYIFGTPDLVKTSILKSIEGTTLNFEIEVVVRYREQHLFLQSSNSVFSYLHKPVVNLVENFLELWDSDKFADVVICVQNAEIPAHRAILAARSPVFAAMLGQNNNKKRIEIYDFEPHTIRSLLRFIYSGTIEKLDTSQAINLLQAANKYDLSDLVEGCSNFLLSRLDSNNALEVLAVADIVDYAVLKQKALDCICENGRNFINAQRNHPVLRRFPHLIGDLLNNALARLESK